MFTTNCSTMKISQNFRIDVFVLAKKISETISAWPSPNKYLQRRIRTISNSLFKNGKLPYIPKTSSCLDLTLLQKNLGMKLAVQKHVKKNRLVPTRKRCWFCTKCLGKYGFYYVMDKTFAFKCYV